MATGGTTSSNRVYLFRLQTLIIDGGTLVLRKIFDQRLPNVPLNVFLANEKTSVNRLQGQKTITAQQYDLLYPQSGRHPKSSDFDITLIICLLRNLRSLGQNHNYHWNATPQAADTSVEADLCRLKRFRNEVAHIASLGIQPVPFQTKWTEIEQVLLRLNSAVLNPDPNLKQTIDSYQNDPLDHAEENRIQNEIRQWREMEKGLEIETDIIKKDVKEVNNVIKEVDKGITKVGEDVKELAKCITKIDVVSKDVEDVAKDVSENIIEVKELKSKVDVITKGVQELQTDVKEFAPAPAFHNTMNAVVSDSRGQKEQGLLKRIKNFFGQKSRSLKALEKGMISLYRDRHSKFQLSPLLEDDTPLLEFYVIPDILSVEVKRGRGSVKEEKTHVSPFSNAFLKENKMCSEIYLTADAGLGKTAFSKRLALAWCHGKKPLANENQYFSSEETEAISKFRFVFLLLLRDRSTECDIDHLIFKQIISQIPQLAFTLYDLEDILATDKCLVILDGLDEWSHPSNSCNQGWSAIPHRKARHGCTVVLTTTRPWKLSTIGLRPSQIEKKLEITGLSPESANILKRSVLSHLFKENDENQVKHYVTEFTKAIEDKHISDLKAVPLLLIFMLFMWYYKIELGHSQCHLYSNFVELLLSRTGKPNERSPIVEHIDYDVPQCFCKLENCRRFYPRLKSLGHLAFQTLFMETREENMLVFDRSEAETYLDEQCLNLFLRAGFITQSKVPGELLEQIPKVSFAHKTVQEFFAALCICFTPDPTSIQETVLSKCKCVKDILEMSKILIFLSGLNVKVSSSISRGLMTIINEDEITREYRSSVDLYPYRSWPLIKQFQDICVSCCEELPHENEVILCLQDVFIEDSCQQENYRENLKQLTARNKQNIKSVHVDIDGMSRAPYSSAQEVIEYFALSDLENIEKIHYNGEYNDGDILPLLNWSVKSLSLSCSSSWSVLLYEKVTSLLKLEVINISVFEMSHAHLTSLYSYISQRHCMRQIVLQWLGCTDLEPNSCTGCSLDLSQHSKLKKITLVNVPLSELNINMSSLETCDLEYLSDPDLVLRFVNCVSAESKFNSFMCRYLKSSTAIETIQQALHLLVPVKHVTLCHINLGNRELLTSEMVNIERVELLGVSMPAPVLRGIVNVLQKHPLTVTVDIHHCNISSESEYASVKDEIKQSAKFTVLEDMDSISGKYLTLETIKDGN